MTVAMKLGHYELLGELGRSGMSMVYHAVDTRTGQVVALKELMVHDIAPEAQTAAIERFLEAGQAALPLRHPNIIRTWDAGETDGRYYIACDIYKGNTLQEYIDKGFALPNLLVLDIVLQTLQALIYAHAEGVPHRNLQPRNITIVPSGQVKVMDFAVGKVAGASSDAATRQRLMGSLAYVAPEMVQGFDAATAKSDLYMLGATMYMLMTQKPVFEADGPQELLGKIAADKPLAPRNINPAIPPPIETAINRCLQKNPTLRHGNAQEIYIELQRFRPALVKMAPPPERYEVKFGAGPSRVAGGGTVRAVMSDIVGKSAKAKFKLSAGRSGGGQGEFSSPRDAVVVGGKAICITDYENGRLQLFGMDGKWQSEIKDPGGKIAPMAVAADKAGRIYVVDANEGVVLVYDDNGTQVGKFGGKGEGAGKFLTPTGIAVSGKGNIFVADSEAGVINVFDPGFTFQGTIGKPGKDPGELKTPYAIAVDDDENLTILEYSVPRIQVMNPKGVSLLCFGARGNEPGNFSVPRGLCIDKFRSIYVADTMNRRIQVFDSQGNLMSHFGHAGDGDGEFAAPEGLDISEKMELVVTDKGNNRFQTFQVEYS